MFSNPFPISICRKMRERPRTAKLVVDFQRADAQRKKQQITTFCQNPCVCSLFLKGKKKRGLGKLYFPSFSPQCLILCTIYTPLLSFILQTHSELPFVCCHVWHTEIQTTTYSYSLPFKTSISNGCCYSTVYFTNMAGECLPQAFHYLLLWSTIYIKFNNLSMLLKVLTSLMSPLKLFTANAIVTVMLILKQFIPIPLTQATKVCLALLSNNTKLISLLLCISQHSIFGVNIVNKILKIIGSKRIFNLHK